MFLFKESLIKSFDKLRTNGKWLIPFVLSLSNHGWNQLVHRFLNRLYLRNLSIYTYMNLLNQSVTFSITISIFTVFLSRLFYKVLKDKQENFAKLNFYRDLINLWNASRSLLLFLIINQSFKLSDTTNNKYFNLPHLGLPPALDNNQGGSTDSSKESICS